MYDVRLYTTDITSIPNFIQIRSMVLELNQADRHVVQIGHNKRTIYNFSLKYDIRKLQERK